MARSVSLSVQYDGTASTLTTREVADTGGATDSSASSGGTHTVVAGDCLWNIAKKYLGAGNRYQEIYDANKDVIESTCKSHGIKNSWHEGMRGYWIWPGEVLSIPGSGSNTTVSGTNTITTVEKTGTSNPALAGQISGSATGFTYTDVASGESDAISITMQDIEKAWMGKNMPIRGADIGVTINFEDWDKAKSLNCGQFILDDISFSGKPTTCVLGAVSVPATDDFKALQRTETYEQTTLKDIAQKVVNRAGISLYYEADTIQIDEIEQSRQTDSAFLSSLCEKYGLAMKIYKHKIVIFDFLKYEEKGAVRTFSEEDMEKWSYNTTVEGTYTGVKFAYTDPDTDKTYEAMIGEEGRIYSVNSQAANKYDAELQAAAKANAANREIETMEITVMPDTSLVATQCVQIFGFGKASGKYFIDRIRHSMTGNGGYSMSLSLHKVQTPIMVTAPQKSENKSYNVGDIVDFKGGTHYVSSYPDAKGYNAKPGKAKITKDNGSGKAHPWHLIHVDSASNVYGWVDDGTFE